MAENHEIVELGSTNRDGNDDVSLSSGARRSRFVASEEAMFGSSEEGAVVAPESSEISAASSSSVYSSARIESMLRSRTEFATAVDWEIEASKDHWSQLEPARSEELMSSDSEDESVQLTNEEIVESLQRQYPQLSDFFHDIAGYLEVGEKIAEGGQADIFTAKRISDRNGDYRYVLKVFKEGSLIRDLQKQWPLGMLNWLPERHMVSRTMLRSPLMGGTVVMNGQFAFLMKRYQDDLRKIIDKRMVRNNNNRCPPLTDLEEWRSMYHIALAMKSLHEDNIIHRDIKAANVLVGRSKNEMEREGIYPLYIADYECSVGVVGTGFWRAPEILQGLKDRMKTGMPVAPELFTKKSDAYSFAMTCYEIVSGKIPFEDEAKTNYSLVEQGVLQGERPILPNWTKPWIKELLSRCWHHDLSERPDFTDIVQYIGRSS